MSIGEENILTRKRVEFIVQDVKNIARKKKENPDYVESTKLVLLELVKALIQGYGEDLPSWTIEWNLGHKPRRYFAISKHSDGRILVRVEKSIKHGAVKWIRIEDIEVEHCWEINQILNKVGIPDIKLLE